VDTINITFAPEPVDADAVLREWIVKEWE